MDEARISAGQTVLIVGASGGVGSFAVQLAAARGARVLATARADAAQKVRWLGATETLDYERCSVSDFVSNLAPGGVDVLFDLASDPESFAAHLELVRPGGRAISIRYAG